MTSVSIFDVSDDMLPQRKPSTNGGHGIGRPKFDRNAIRSILAAYEGGEAIRAIARRHGCTPEAIRYQLRRHGIEGRRTLGQGATGDALQRCCSRCGIGTTDPDMCQDCVDVLALAVPA